MHNTLYLTYRPQNFDEIEGQQHIRRTIQNAAKQDRFAHAYLFSGPRGTGKTTTARIVAKAINCSSLLPDGNPCNLCSNCVEITQGSFVDVIEIDAASNRGIEDIRNLKERISFTPTVGKKKVYIIDEVHMLSKDASNALLKTLEEPPVHVHFILATTEFHKILPTIVSRCQYFQYYPLTIEDIVERLTYICTKEGFYFEKEALELLAEHAKGGMRDAISLLEKAASDQASVHLEHVRTLVGVSSEELYAGIVTSLVSKDPQAFITTLTELEKSGNTPEQFLRSLRKYIRKIYIAELAKGKEGAQIPLYTKILKAVDIAVKESKYAEFPLLPLELCMGELLTPERSEAITSTPAHKVEHRQPPSPSLSKPVEMPKPTASTSSPAPSVPIREPLPTTQTVPVRESASPVETPVVSTQDPVFVRLKGEWASFCFKLDDIALRSALKSCTVVDLTDGVLHLMTANSLHHSVLLKESSHEKVVAALQEHYDLQCSIQIDLAKKGESISTPKTPAPVQAAPQPVQPKEEPQKTPAPDQAEVERIAAFFGGEIIN